MYIHTAVGRKSWVSSPGPAIYLFQTVFPIGPDCDKLPVSASTSQGSSCLCLPSAGGHTWNYLCLSKCHPVPSPFLTFLHFPGTELGSLCPMSLCCKLSYCSSTQMIDFNCYFFVILLMCVGSLSGAAPTLAGPLDPFPSFFCFSHSVPLCKLEDFHTLWKACVWLSSGRNTILWTVRDNWAQFNFLLSSC